MSAGYELAYDALQRSSASLEAVRQESDITAKETQLKMAMHSLCQAARLAHRCYEVGFPKGYCAEGGTYTWVRDELTEFMAGPYKLFTNKRFAYSAETEEYCRIWLDRAKHFVDTLYSSRSSVPKPVNEAEVEWKARNVGQQRRYNLDEMTK